MSWYPGWYKAGSLPRTYGGTVRSAALLHGSGTSVAPTLTSAANKNFLGYWVKSSAVSGDARALYARLYLDGASGGEAVRAYATAEAAATAVGGTINGMHATMSIAAGAGVSGAGNAGRFTLAADAEVRSLGGNIACLQLDSDIAAGNTLPATASFLRLTKSGAVDLTTFMQIDDDQVLKGSAATGAASDALKVVLPGGTVRYISLIAAS